MIYPYDSVWPKLHETAFIAPSADVIGDVMVGENSSVWFQCVVRGDVNYIRIGDRTNVQDQSTLHVTRKTCPLIIGNDVTIGHRVLLHGCRIGDRVLIGMGSIVMDNAEISSDCIIGAGSLVTEGKKFPSGVLIMGAPARVIRELTTKELAFLKKSADNYVGDSALYRGDIRGAALMGASQNDLENLELDEDDLT